MQSPLLSLTVLVSLAAGARASGSSVQEGAPERRPLELTEDTIDGERIYRGTFDVWEDRELDAGRVLGLDVVVIPSRAASALRDPIFFLAGGPGQAATQLAPGLIRSWMRADRDVVLVDQRGTGGNHRLQCEPAGGADDYQGYFDVLMEEETFRGCLAKLSQRANLSLYSTPLAMDDLDELRQVLGYEQINLIGGSYGTRAALVYLRRHGEHVRCAVLQGVAPLALKNPLFHAISAQHALDALIADCANDPDCARTFPDFEAQLGALFQRLAEAPVRAQIKPQGAQDAVVVSLGRETFADALRVLLYSSSGSRRIPSLVDRAHEGDWKAFAQLAFERRGGLRRQLALGMLLSVTCAEDVARIDPAVIAAATRGTFLGDGRVRRQMAVCEFWPQGRIPKDYAEPVTSEVPVLLFSGTVDPVTPPIFGQEAASHLPNSVHLTAPTAHDYGHPCLTGIVREFVRKGTSEGLDVTCIEQMQLPPFVLE